jgi:hypothetical protein
VIAENGDTATVSCDGVGGPVRFPLVRIASRRFGRRAVDSHHSAVLSTIVDKKRQIGSFALLVSKRRENTAKHHAKHRISKPIPVPTCQTGIG